MPPRRPVERVENERWCHNGSESWVLLPLRKGGRRAMPPRRPVERVEHERWCHNGTYSRVLLPLWKKKDASRARYPMREFRQMSRVSSTGQWSEPKISLWMAAPRSLGCRRLETRK